MEEGSPFNLLLASDLFDAKSDAGTPAQYTTFQPSIHVSGPIARDRLWYRLSLEAVKRSSEMFTVGG